MEVETTDPLGNYAAGSEDIRPLEDEIEYADADESEYTSEDLDAHTIHDGVGFRASAPVDAEYTEYDEYAEPREDDGTYGEAAEDPGDQQTFDCTESAEYTALAVVNETLTTLPDVLGEFAEVQSVTPVEGEVIYPAWERSDTGNNYVLDNLTFIFLTVCFRQR